VVAWRNIRARGDLGLVLRSADLNQDVERGDGEGGDAGHQHRGGHPGAAALGELADRQDKDEQRASADCELSERGQQAK
jgi:hypothetical protein